MTFSAMLSKARTMAEKSKGATQQANDSKPALKDRMLYGGAVLMKSNQNEPEKPAQTETQELSPTKNLFDRLLQPHVLAQKMKIG